MTYLDNRSLFPAELLSFPTIAGQEAQVLVVLATYQETETGVLAPAAEQRPVPLSDVYFGEPALSSVRYEAETAIRKKRVDILVNGSAYAPGARPAREVIVELEAPGIRKSLRVSGDRYHSTGGPSAPQPFLTMPLIYERAYGGTDTVASDPKRHAVCYRNPVGIGFRSARPASPDVLTEVPNVELLSGNQSTPAGFGIISRAWSPRREWAGTFDQGWLEDQWPLFPRDFDPRHYQSAPEDQQTDSIKAEDRICIKNCTPDGQWIFAVPSVDLPVWLVFENRIMESRMTMDSLMAEPDSRRVSMTFRLPLELERGRDLLREIVVGQITPGILRAKFRRKAYLDFRNAANANGKGIA